MDNSNIRDEILSELRQYVPEYHAMQPGDITYEDIMAELGITYTAVRSLMKQLEEEGKYKKFHCKRNGKSMVFFRKVQSTG